MSILYIPIGTTGSGKTTYYEKNYKQRKDIERISADDVRFKLLDYEHTGRDYEESLEPTVWSTVYATYTERLKAKESVYFDCTNLTLKERSQIIIRALRTQQYKIELIWFDIPLWIALKWNAQRERRIKEKIIAQQYLRLEPPQEYEYDSLMILGYDPIAEVLIQTEYRKGELVSKPLKISQLS